MRAPSARRSVFATLPLRFCEQGGIPLFDLQPGYHLGLPDPSIVLFQFHPHWLFEIRKTDLPIAVTIHFHFPQGLSARFLPDSFYFLCTYYTANGGFCLDFAGFFDCSGDTNLD